MRHHELLHRHMTIGRELFGAGLPVLRLLQSRFPDASRHAEIVTARRVPVRAATLFRASLSCTVAAETHRVLVSVANHCRNPSFVTNSCDRPNPFKS